MTQVVVDVTHFTDGPQERGVGVVVCTTFAEVLDDDHFVAVKPFTVDYPAAAVTIEAEELPEGNAWWFELRVDEYLIKRLVAPTGVGPVNLVDLVNLDPNTLTPAVDQSPAWIAVLAGVNAHLDEVDEALEAEVNARSDADALLQPKETLSEDAAAEVEDETSALAVAVAAKIATESAEQMGNPETPLAGATQELIDEALSVFSPTDSVKAFDIAGALTTARPAYAGILQWMTSASTGVPLHAAAGDLVVRYTTVPIETIIWSDDFLRANGAVGSTPVGGIAWENLSAGTALTVASNKAAPSGTGTGAAYFGVNGGRADGIFRAKIDTNVTGYIGLCWNVTDVSNNMTLARVSSGDLTYRIVKRVAGTSTTVKATGVAIANGDQIEVDTRTAGHMKVKINNVLVYDESVDTAVSIDAAAKAGTKFGFYTGNLTAGINGRWDDASFSTGGI